MTRINIQLDADTILSKTWVPDESITGSEDEFSEAIIVTRSSKLGGGRSKQAKVSFTPKANFVDQ